MTKQHDAISWWQQKMLGAVESQLPTDYPRSIPQQVVEGEYAADFKEKDGETTLISALAILLCRYTGEEECCILFKGQDGMLPLRLQVRGSDTLAQLLIDVQQAQEDANRNAVPYDHLVAALGGLQFGRVRFGVSGGIGSSELAVAVSDGCLSVAYNAVLYKEERVVEIVRQLQVVANCFQQPDATLIGDVALINQEQQSLLPKPSLAILKDEWPGTIHDVFMSNAQMHPERLCIVDSVDGENVHAYTYKQVDEMSSQVANTLLRNDKIHVGSVVVVYAHRCTELAICIMGILKAGCTFSVIDPAYPAERQLVYLGVARPTAALTLKLACALDEVVAQWLQDPVNEVALIVDDISCQWAGHDVILSCGGKYSNLSTNTQSSDFVKVHAHDIGTLSFTSGSTGIPKGVRGRHYALTQFYPFMARKFSLTERDVFTMLSGIAHDPIQRDIFTPLFLGAVLYVPCAEDIMLPGRLAQWMAAPFSGMKKYTELLRERGGCTVTHLTPAMGQVLSVGADNGSVESLKHAFFVGDILTKRDVLRIQTLCPNVTVVNMYGTTETQRAVSYYAIPPTSSSIANEKDVMPAGIGMQGVQLIVVNQKLRQCGVGEVGEIYVRSHGLAEGYLRLERDTAAKFLPNFFRAASHSDSMIQDRMYKTGDLGRYRTDGVVECCGRADDQVKIRGFRIELSEIDTHLSQLPGVRENVTLVKRDAYEEKVLISYIVADADYMDSKGIVDIRKLIAGIREQLSHKLPKYALPSIIVPLIKMPLTPNGKVDKNALPFPNEALINELLSGGGSHEDAASHTQLQRQLAKIWNAVLYPPLPSGVTSPRSVGISDNFFDVGGHSILATRLIFQVRQQLKLDKLPLNLLNKCPTIQQMASEIEIITNFGVSATASPMPTRKRIPSANGHLVADTTNDDVFDYAADAVLPEDFCIRAGQTSLLSVDGKFTPRHVFLTGATGFLGAFLLQSLLARLPDSRVSCLVRSSDNDKAWLRLKQNMISHRLWTEDSALNMQKRVNVVTGDLAHPWLGIGKSDLPDKAPQEFAKLADEIDCVVHNGALVHWVYPYSKLKAANVDGTLYALKLCILGKQVKPFVFVSSTSVLDTPYYTETRSGAVMESDNLDGASTGLGSGYGQSKWVAERLLMQASRERNLPAAIVRPGYILGDTRSGVTNSDDFLWRLMKGCLELGQVPVIRNAVNACPVDFVADCCVQVLSMGQPACDRLVYQVWNDQNVRFTDFFTSLLKFGYGNSDANNKSSTAVVGLIKLESKPYMEWRDALTQLTLSGTDSALYPLLHFVLDDLPTSTKSPPLDASNLQWALAATDIKFPHLFATDNGKSAGSTKFNFTNTSVREPLMDKYLTYLCQVGFLPVPHGKDIEKVTTSVIGRSGN